MSDNKQVQKKSGRDMVSDLTSGIWLLIVIILTMVILAAIVVAVTSQPIKTL